MIWACFLLFLGAGWALGRYWPRLSRYLWPHRVPVHPGQLTCILYDKALLVEHSRLTMRGDVYLPELHRPHGRTLPTVYKLYNVTATHGEYREV